MKLYKDSDRPNIAEKADLIWRPSEKVSDKQMDQYLSEVINEHAYNIHQAIGLLNFCDHDINKATALSRKLKPKPEEWTKEEKVMFEHAFWFHGKNFNKIKLLVSIKHNKKRVRHIYQVFSSFILATTQEPSEPSKLLLYLEENSNAKESNGLSDGLEVGQ